ncbi:MAG: nucleotidyltransferase domain-containing protein [Clostridium sp.]
MGELSTLQVGNFDNLVSMAVFGSYGTKYWSRNRSDIDILVLIKYRRSVMDEFVMEEILEPILKEHFKYDKIHLTFLNMSEYDSVFARQYIESKDKLIIDPVKELDFRLYVNKFLRENHWLIERIEKDRKLMEENNVTIL